MLLMHFPLYRGSEASCLLTDTNSPHVNFAGRDVVSHAQTQRLLGMVEPRFVFSAHMHHYCAVMHGAVPEVTVSTFNWRNRQDPSFVLAAITTGTDADTDGAAENAQDAMHTDPKVELWLRLILAMCHACQRALKRSNARQVRSPDNTSRQSTSLMASTRALAGTALVLAQRCAHGDVHDPTRGGGVYHLRRHGPPGRSRPHCGRHSRLLPRHIARQTGVKHY